MNLKKIFLITLLSSHWSTTGADITKYLVAVQPYNKQTKQFDAHREIKKTCEKNEIKETIKAAYQKLKQKETQLKLFNFFVLKGFDPDVQCEWPEKEYVEIAKKLEIKIIIAQLKKSPNLRRGMLNL